MKKDAYYFSHDSNATNDPKIMMMIAQWGLEAYGIYWTLIEHLREQPNYTSHISILKALSMRYNSSEEKYRYVVNDFGLFVIDENLFFSPSLIHRMQHLDNKREKARQSALKRWNGSERNANALETHSESNASKVKESKVKESKVNNIKEREANFKNEIMQYNYPSSMLLKFFDYWSEPNKSNTKMKFETQKTWDLSRRLKRWSDNNFDTKESAFDIMKNNSF